MTDVEERIVNVDRRQESFEMFTRENLKSMRQQQESFEQFVRTYIDINERKLEQMDARHEASMQEIRSELRSIGKHVQNLTITAMASIGAIGIAVVGFIISQATK